MRSPLMVPLVLLTLLLLATQTYSVQQSKGPSEKSTKVRDKSEKMVGPTVEVVTDKPVYIEVGEETIKVGKKLVKDEAVLAAMESNLLSLFGFSRRPRPRRDIVIPQAMKDLYRRQTGMDVETTNLALPGRLTASANTVRTFTHKESEVDDQFKQRHRFRLSFEVKAIPKSEQLKAAELHLSAHGAHHILVHDIVRPGVRGSHTPILRLVDSRRVLPTDGRVRLDVTPAVQRWLADPAGNHGLLVVVQDGDSDTDVPHVRLKRDVSTEEWKEVQPVLFTYTDDGKQKKNGSLVKRPRRGARKHKWKESRDICRRHELYVDFVAAGWSDWIVAPPGYDAYYCSGQCPFPLAHHLNATNHAIVQSLISDKTPDKVPKACCVPTALTAISMLYLDEEGKIVLKNYEDMQIVGCGCR